MGFDAKEWIDRNNIKPQNIFVIYIATFLLEYVAFKFADVNEPLALKNFEGVKFWVLTQKGEREKSLTFSWRGAIIGEI